MNLNEDILRYGVERDGNKMMFYVYLQDKEDNTIANSEEILEWLNNNLWTKK